LIIVYRLFDTSNDYYYTVFNVGRMSMMWYDKVALTNRLILYVVLIYYYYYYYYYYYWLLITIFIIINIIIVCYLFIDCRIIDIELYTIELS